MITAERLRELFDYVSETGRLSRKIVRQGEKKITEGRAKNGYLIRWVDRACYYEHVLVYLYHTGIFIPEIDHRNRIRDDNRFVNLRPCDRTLNNANRGPIKSRTGFRGVTYRKDIRKYHSRIKVYGEIHLLGNYASVVDAAHAYDVAALKHFGEFARLNFPESQ